MALKKVKTTTTTKGTNLKEVIENYTKINHKDNTTYNCTDICVGTSKDYGNFIIFIDDNKKSFGYVPKSDLENVTEQIDEIIAIIESDCSFEFSFEMKRSKNNRDYCVVNY